MDFLERCLHISPDGGSGATEAIYIAVVVLIALALVLRRVLTAWSPIRDWTADRSGASV